MTAYLLSEHVYACQSGSHVILLDVLRDQYLAVDAESARLLTESVYGWPTFASGAASTVMADARRDTTIRRFLAEGLLTTDPRAAKKPAKELIEPPSKALLEQNPETTPVIQPRYVPDFLLSFGLAAAMLRLRHFAKVVTRVRARREREAANSGDLDLGDAAELVAAFDALRPFAFASKDACLLHALALLEFLSLHRIFPSWVFGVRTEPFAAHCWVQHRDVVFNDVPDYVSRYTPIMAI